jgi:hypothetical protein
MKENLLMLGLAAMLGSAVQAQIAQPVIPNGKLAVFKCGTSDTNYPMLTSRSQPCFVQVFDPATSFQTTPLISVTMATNSSTPGSVWVNAHAGSEGGGISRSVDRQFLCLEGYVGNILSPQAAKPSTDPSVNRGIVTLDAFTNAISVLTTPTGWFGIPVGSATGTQDNPTGIASLDGTNFYGTGNFAPIGPSSGELDGTLYFNSLSGNLQEVQQFIQSAAEARVIGGTLLVASLGSKNPGLSALISFIDPATGDPVPLPWYPNVANPYFNFAFTNVFLNWASLQINGSTPQNVSSFDMDPAQTVAYGADQTYGIIKFTNNAGVWTPAPYFFSTTNIGTMAQTSGNQGCFSVCVDFSGTNPVIYATTMENGAATNYPGGFGVNAAAGHQNNNRIIRIVDTGVAPGTNYVATTLAVATTTNEFYGGVDFTPDLTPLITANPANYETTAGNTAPFGVTVQSVSTLSYQWLQNGTNLDGSINPTATNASLSLPSVGTSYDGNTYQCVITNNYGSVTSSIATLNVTTTPKLAQFTATNNLLGFVGSTKIFPAIPAVGTQPFYTYQWFNSSLQPLVDDGVKYSGSQTASLIISNLTLADSGSYYLSISNAAGNSATNPVIVLTVSYQLPYVPAPAPATTLVGTPVSLTADESGGTPPLTYQWYNGNTPLSPSSEFSNPNGSYAGAGSATLGIAATTTADSGNYKIVYTNPGGSVTSLVAAVSVLPVPAHSFVSYTNQTQVYSQGFEVLPDPGSLGSKSGVVQASGVSVNSLNNPKDPGQINGVTFSIASPFDFAYPVINSGYVGGLALGPGSANVQGTKGDLSGWYGAADTNTLADGVDGITRFGAQDGDQSTGGVIDFGPNDVGGAGGILGTNRSLGLLSTSTTGSTSFGLKLINKTGKTLNYINLSYIGEMWRNNKAHRIMSFSYAVDPTANTFVLQSEPTGDTNGYPQIIPGTTRVDSMAFSFPTNDGSVLAFDGTQPANQKNLAASNLQLSTPWPANGALWLIWSINYYGQGTGQGYSIDNVRFSASNVPSTLIQPLKINGYNGQVVSISGSGASTSATINFSNAPGLTFSVHSTNNIAVPLAAWPVIGTVTDSGTPGVYQFVDPNPATSGQSYYYISIP